MTVINQHPTSIHAFESQPIFVRGNERHLQQALILAIEQENISQALDSINALENVNFCKPKTTRTVLHLAVLHGLNEVVAALLAKNADYNKKMALKITPQVTYHLTPLELALQISRMKSRPEELHRAPGIQEAIKTLVKHDPALRCVFNERDESPLHIVASTPKFFDLLTFFLDKSLPLCNINLENSGFSTPLHQAAFINNTSAVKFLLDKGADPLLKLNGGETAADLTTNKEILALLRPKEISSLQMLCFKAMHEQAKNPQQQVDFSIPEHVFGKDQVASVLNRFKFSDKRELEIKALKPELEKDREALTQKIARLKVS